MPEYNSPISIGPTVNVQLSSGTVNVGNVGIISILSGQVQVTSGQIQTLLTSGMLAVLSGQVSVSSGLLAVLSGSLSVSSGSLFVSSGQLAVLSGTVYVSSGQLAVLSGLVGVTSGIVALASGFVSLLPPVSGGWSTYRASGGTWPAFASGVLVKSTPGQVGGWYFFNRAASGAVVHLHDTNLAANAASALLVTHTFDIPASGGACVQPGSVGIQFNSGIGIIVTGNTGDADATAVLSGMVSVNLFYK